MLVREFTGNVAPYTPYADTRYSYDERDNLTRVGSGPHNNSQPGSFERETTMSYDALGRKTRMNDADMGIWLYDYDVAGNLRWQQAPDNQAICFYYDGLNRLVQRQKDDNGSEMGCPAMLDRNALKSSEPLHLASYVYGGAGNLGRLTNVYWGSAPQQNGDAFAYDAQGRMKWQKRTINGQLFELGRENEPIVYDALDQPKSVKYPDGNTLTTTYDQEGVDALSYGGQQVLSHVTYTALGQPATVDRAGTMADTTYDYYGVGENFRLKSIAHGTGTTFPGFTYSAYDNAGNLTGQTIWGKAYTYGYDALNRLTSVRGNLSQDYTYDRLGNFDTVTKWGVTWDYSYQKDDNLTHKPLRLTTVSGLNFSAAPTTGYDGRGNLTQYTQGDVSSTLAYDVEGRLTSVTTQQGTQATKTTEFFYDADGNRVRVLYPGTGGDIYTPFPDVEKAIAGSVTTWRITFSAAGQMVAQRVTAGATVTLYSLHADRLGSVVAVGNAGGGLVGGSYAAYEPFGTFLVQPTGTNPSVTDRGFTGQRSNNLSPAWLGLVYMNARYYHPQLGRFVSPDTIVPEPGEPQSYNRYSYSYNNPINYIDPSGRSPSDGCNYSEGCNWDSTPYGDNGGAYPYGQTVAVDYYYDPPGAPMHLYTSPTFGHRPAYDMEQWYGGAGVYVTFDTDYLWMKFDVLRQYANESEIDAMAAREARAMCNSAGGRCSNARVSSCLGAMALPFALASAEAAGVVSTLAALLEGADAVAHNDGGNIGQVIVTEITGVVADGALPGVGGSVINGVDLVVDMASLSALETSYRDEATYLVREKLHGWRQIEGRFANEQRWGPTLPWINPVWP